MVMSASPDFSRQGLSESAARSRLKTEGFNELPRSERRTSFRIFLEVLREPMLALLLASAFIYLFLGDLRETLILFAFATMSVAITVVQETRTERVLEALRDLTSPRALVIRDGDRKRVAGREVVRGDLVILSEGDRVPADVRLLEANDLHTDESLLTGESVPVRKSSQVLLDDGLSTGRPGGEDLPFAFSGSMVVRGTAVAEVIATGPRSEIGKIGQSILSLETEAPRLQTQTRKVVALFAIGGSAVSIAAILLYGFTRGGWLDAILAGIALGMSMLPAEFPVVLTVFMAMGAWRISRARVLTRRAAAIETLGSATVLCTDKTGTLTQNRMTVVELRSAQGSVWKQKYGDPETIPLAFHSLVESSVLASARDPFDPMEKAFHELGRKITATGPAYGTTWSLVRTYGLRPDLLAMTQVWQRQQDDIEFFVAAKGAPEAIVQLCRLAPKVADAVKRDVELMAAQGLRVLGLARAAHVEGAWPESQCEFKFDFLGLAGLADPLRASVPNAVAECRSAGIRVVMITGDYPATARAIAHQAGLDVKQLLSGENLEKLSDFELLERVRVVTVFARIMPEQKLRIVNAFKANGEIVAMTGDGANDAPSLKAAHIGVAMGGRGTDVAREASSIVLLDDDFGSIVKAIRLGRRIYDNLRKAMGFISAVHIPIAGLALLPLIFGLPIIFGPIHIAFLQMIIDPVCSLVFEAETEEAGVMRRPPRPPDELLFSRSLIIWSFVQGTFVLALVAVIFIVAFTRGMPDDEVRALAFFSLVAAIVGLIFINRSFSASITIAFSRPNRTLVLVLICVLSILGSTLFLPFMRDLFHFGPLHSDDVALTLAAGAVVLFVLEMLKRQWVTIAASPE
jgi:P-type Ca2+ transporter type 2C